MQPSLNHFLHSRRDFFTSSASGLGGLGLAWLMAQDSLAAPISSSSTVNPLVSKPPHFEARAKSCIFIFLAGAPSQIDLFDPKPKLLQLDGQPLPESLGKNVRFAFIDTKTAMLKGSPRKFRPHGECGMEISDRLPHIATCADDMALVRSMVTEEFNHHPAQQMMNCGVGRLGRPSIGSWLTYGLGSASSNLPGYVVLSAGSGTSGGASNWTSGFLPSTFQGVPFRTQGEPVLNLQSPPGISRPMQREGLEAITQLNQIRFRQSHDSEIANRISSYELAFNMQAEAPDLLDLTQETHSTLEAYGVERPDPLNRRYRAFRPGTMAKFSRNCLLARRLVERGVRFINLYHATWDHHDALEKDLAYNCRIVDQPVAALLKDLKQRGLLDSTLVVFAGEFGRTPLADNHETSGQKPGRDHHPFAFSLWMAGGGVSGGQVVGRTDEIGWAPVEDPVHINDFHATLLHLFGIEHLKLTRRFGGFDLRLTNVGGKVVEKLLT